MLIDNTNKEHFKDMTRDQINNKFGNKKAEKLLANLKEVFYNQNKYKLADIARIKQ